MTTAHHPVHAHAGQSAPLRGLARLLPGVLLSAGVGAVAFGLQLIETSLFGHPWIEGLVIAILMGAGIRLFWTPSNVWTPGVQFSAKTLLEVAVALLGATISAQALAAAAIAPARRAQYEVKLGGVPLRDESQTLADSGVRAGAPLVVLSKRRRPVR